MTKDKYTNNEDIWTALAMVIPFVPPIQLKNELNRIIDNMSEKEYTVKLTKNQIEELIHATITSYMEYDEHLFYDKVLQEQYNEGVTKYNNTIDEIRIKLKEALKEV